MIKKKKGSVFGGALLVAGTCIGGGMLALPVLTSLGGFYPSLVVFAACWVFMAATGLLILEACLWMDGETNLVSIAERTLGKGGRVVAWLLYLFLFYTLTVAYISGSGDFVAGMVGDSIPEYVGMVIFVGLFGGFVFAGARSVDRVNVWLMVGLGVSYAVILWLGAPHVNTDLLQHRNWYLSLVALPIAFTSFGFQGIVPTIVNYMHRDVRRVRKAIIIGSLVPLVAYGVWEWLIHGIVPAQGPGGLVEALHNNQSAVRPLKNFIDNPTVVLAGNYFAFFALVTSFLGVTLGLRDFLADGLRVKKDRSGKILLCAIIFIPPMLFSVLTPHLFLEALNFAGGFGVVLLLGMLPIAMVWAGRYHHKLPSRHQIPGGQVTLVALTAFVVIEVVCEVAHLLKYL